MQLKELKLTHFRNHSNGVFKFSQKTLLVGPNGAGKSNIIEAIRYLSVLKSFRTRKESESIEFGYDFTRVVGHINVDEYEKPIVCELVITPEAKRIKMNSIPKPIVEAVGFLPTVLFSPAEASLAAEGPPARRRLMDSILVQIDRQYLWSLGNYQRVLKQRNILLKNIASGKEHERTLAPWDDQLIEYAQYISQKRIDLVQMFNEQVTNRYRLASGHKATVVMQPRLSVVDQDRLRQCRVKDLRFGSTTIGPHHDDFVITLNNRLLSSFGSRGEWRSVVVAIKSIEGDIIYTKTRRRPIYLLDDVFSELDQHHRELVINFFDPCQVVFTTADTEHPWGKIEGVEVIEL